MGYMQIMMYLIDNRLGRFQAYNLSFQGIALHDLLCTSIHSPRVSKTTHSSSLHPGTSASQYTTSGIKATPLSLSWCQSSSRRGPYGCLPFLRSGSRSNLDALELSRERLVSSVLSFAPLLCLTLRIPRAS